MDRWHQSLSQIGLVPVRLGTEEVGGGSVWWIGAKRAEELVSLGKAVLVPLPTSDDKSNDNSD